MLLLEEGLLLKLVLLKVFCSVTDVLVAFRCCGDRGLRRGTSDAGTFGVRISLLVLLLLLTLVMLLLLFVLLSLYLQWRQLIELRLLQLLSLDGGS